MKACTFQLHANQKRRMTWSHSVPGCSARSLVVAWPCSQTSEMTQIMVPPPQHLKTPFRDQHAKLVMSCTVALSCPMRNGRDLNVFAVTNHGSTSKCAHWNFSLGCLTDSYVDASWALNLSFLETPEILHWTDWEGADSHHVLQCHHSRQKFVALWCCAIPCAIAL